MSTLKPTDYYPDSDRKVFFGYYWLKEEPSLYKDNICCLDYSIAKGGKLITYLLNGEVILDKNNLIYIY